MRENHASPDDLDKTQMAADLITVFGASGFIGRYVVRHLAKQGYRIRAAVRRPNLANFLLPMGDVGQIQLAQTNIRNEDSIKRALTDADGAVNLVGVLKESGKQKFSTLHAEAPGTIASIAAANGISRFVQMSAIGADPASNARYAQTKGEGEAAVRKALPHASIVRPSIVFGAEDEFFNRFAGMARISPFLPLIGGGRTKFQPVYVGDVADAIGVLLANEEFAGRTIELGGPKVYTFKELLELVKAETNRSNMFMPVPFPIASLMGALTGWLPFAPLTLDQVRLLRSDNVVGTSTDPEIAFLNDLGIEATSVEAIVPQYLWRFRPHGEFEEPDYEQSAGQS